MSAAGDASCSGPWRGPCGLIPTPRSRFREPPNRGGVVSAIQYSRQTPPHERPASITHAPPGLRSRRCPFGRVALRVRLRLRSSADRSSQCGVLRHRSVPAAQKLVLTVVPRRLPLATITPILYSFHPTRSPDLHFTRGANSIKSAILLVKNKIFRRLRRRIFILQRGATLLKGENYKEFE